jgi:ferredoxin
LESRSKPVPRARVMVMLRSTSLLSGVAFAVMFVIIVALAGALLMGYGPNADRSRRPYGREEPLPRAGRQPRAQRLPMAEPERGGGGVFKGGGKFGVSHQANKMVVEVNPNKCARFGFCAHEAPDVFFLESDGRFGYEASVSVEKMERVISAMDVCPRRAIKVKLPPEYAEARVRPEEPPEDLERKIVPIRGDRDDDGSGRRSRRAY